MCICFAVGGVWLAILEKRRKAGMSPLPVGADDIMRALLIFVEYKNAAGIVFTVYIQRLQRATKRRTEQGRCHFRRKIAYEQRDA